MAHNNACQDPQPSEPSFVLLFCELLLHVLSSFILGSALAFGGMATRHVVKICWPMER